MGVNLIQYTIPGITHNLVAPAERGNWKGGKTFLYSRRKISRSKTTYKRTVTDMRRKSSLTAIFRVVLSGDSRKREQAGKADSSGHKISTREV